jgi:hypothetical protein
MSSRTMSGVHRSARISDARATGQYCLYFCMLHRGTPRSPEPVQKLNRFSPLVALPPAFPCAYFLVIETLWR